MTGCYLMDAVGRKGGLVMMWTDECDVDVQSFYLNHVEVLVKIKDMRKLKFTGFYGQPKLNQR